MPVGSGSVLGRVAAQKALRHQLRQDASGRSAVASLPGVAIMTAGGPVMLPAGMLVNELSNNAFVHGNKNEARKKLNKSEKNIKDRSWKEQLKDGLKKSPLWALGGGVGGGLGGYALSGGKFDPTWASALGGAVVGGISPVAMSLLSKLVIDNSSRDTLNKAKDNISSQPVTTSIPFIGDILAASGLKPNVLDRKIAN